MWGVNDVPEDPEKGHIRIHSKNLIRMAISLVLFSMDLDLLINTGTKFAYFIIIQLSWRGTEQAKKPS
jgi:hypothetical protein